MIIYGESDTKTSPLRHLTGRSRIRGNGAVAAYSNVVVYYITIVYISDAVIRIAARTWAFIAKYGASQK